MTKEAQTLYILCETNYIKKNQNKTKEEIFPINWYSISDYPKKIEILVEAIKDDVLIKDTNKYKEYIGESIRLNP